MAFAMPHGPCPKCGLPLHERLWDLSFECRCGYKETYEQRRQRKEGEVEAKECKQCGKTFTPKYEWSTMCWGCWWETPAGKAYKARKEDESNGFDRARAGREREERNDNFWEDRQEQQSRHRESFRDAFRGGNDSGVVGLDKMMLRKLLQLCHPDKHGGSALATAVTAELLKMKDRL